MICTASRICWMDGAHLPDALHLLVMMDTSPICEALFTRLYDVEHVPLLLSCPAA